MIQRKIRQNHHKGKIMSNYFVYLIGFFSLWLAPLHSSLHLDEIMTPHELRVTGVEELSTKERKALEQWLTGWSDTILKQGYVSAVNRDGYEDDIIDPRDNTFTIEENIEKGDSLKLDDGTLWKIAPKYRKQTRSWTKGQSVVLTRVYKRGYTHQLFNLDFGAGVDVWQASAKNYIAAPSGVASSEKTHRIDEIISNGERIKLDDGSSWEIFGSDRLEAQAWLPEDKIRIERSGDAIYPQKLINLEHNESISAKLLSK